MIDALILFLLTGAAVLLTTKDAKGSLPDFNTISQEAEQAVDYADIDILARTMWGEARNEGYAGMQAVANVVMNRYKLAQSSAAKARQFGDSVAEICQKPYQFSVWNNGDPNLPLMLKVTSDDQRFVQALTIARKAVTGTLADITGGADHYLNIDFTRQIRGGSLPNWVDLNKKTADIGAHTFLKLA